MQAGRQVYFHLSNMCNEWFKDPDAMRVLNKSMQNPMADYTAEEWAQLNFTLKTYWHAIEAQYISHKSGLGVKGQDNGYLRSARTTLATWPAWKKCGKGKLQTISGRQDLSKRWPGTTSGTLEVFKHQPNRTINGKRKLRRFLLARPSRTTLLSASVCVSLEQSSEDSWFIRRRTTRTGHAQHYQLS